MIVMDFSHVFFDKNLSGKYFQHVSWSSRGDMALGLFYIQI